jgi:hypothetical protein
MVTSIRAGTMLERTCRDPMIELRTLSYFMTACRSVTFALAAKELGIRGIDAQHDHEGIGTGHRSDPVPAHQQQSLSNRSRA